MTGGMTNFYPYIGGSLEGLFSELFFYDACCIDGINTNLLLLTFPRTEF